MISGFFVPQLEEHLKGQLLMQLLSKKKIYICCVSLKPRAIGKVKQPPKGALDAFATVNTDVVIAGFVYT